MDWIKQLMYSNGHFNSSTSRGGGLGDKQLVGQEEPQLNRLQGKIAVITGGSSGMRFATAEQFVSEGAYVYITGRREKELNAAVAKLERMSRPSRVMSPTWKTLTGSTQRLQRRRGALTLSLPMLA